MQTREKLIEDLKNLKDGEVLEVPQVGEYDSPEIWKKHNFYFLFELLCYTWTLTKISIHENEIVDEVLSWT